MPDVLTPPTLEAGAKHGLAGKVVDTLHPFNEGDEATVLAEYLTLFGAHLGLKTFFRIGQTRHYPRIFMTVVGQSGSSRKGTTYNLVSSVFSYHDSSFLRENSRKNVGSDQGLISAALDSLEWAQERGYPDARLMVVENEFVTLLSGGTLMRTSPMIRDAWDTNSLQSTVKKARRAENVHMCMIGMITLDELRRLLPNYRVQSQVTNGLFNRFLLILAQESKKLPLDKMMIPEAKLGDLATRTMDAVRFGRSLGEVSFEPAVIQAQFAWRQQIARKREQEVKKAKIAGRMFDLLNRGETYLLRLAFIYAVLDHSPKIKLEHFRAAEALWSYVEGSVRYIFEIPGFSLHAQKILSAIETAGPFGLTQTEINAVLNRHKSVAAAVDELTEAGLIVLTEVKVRTGRPRKVYRMAEYQDLNLDLSLDLSG